MANEALKSLMRERNVRQWEIADRLGMSEITLCRKLRYELPAEGQKKILAAIDDIKREKKNNGK